MAELVETFVATSFTETTATLTALRAMVTDEVLAARIGRELAARRHPLPAWLTGLHQARIEPDVWFLTHVLGDGDDYLFGVTLPSGHSLSALVYVDHNLGGVVKDAFVVSERVDDMALKLGSTIDGPDQSLTRTDGAGARAVMERAIDHGSRLYPPLESESWPMSRPLVEWMLRLLPPGGIAAEAKEWSDQEMAGIADAFFASAFGVPFDRDDERSLLESVLWFGTGYATGDPFRWSPVTVAMLLEDWFPRKVVAEPSFLARLPDLLRAYIRYCHDGKGIRAALTEETLAAVDDCEPDYQEAIRSARSPDPAALLAGMLAARAAEECAALSTRRDHARRPRCRCRRPAPAAEPGRRSVAGGALRVGRHRRGHQARGPGDARRL